MKKVVLLSVVSAVSFLFAPSLVNADSVDESGETLTEVQSFDEVSVKAAISNSTDANHIEIEEVPSFSLYNVNPNVVTKEYDATFYFPTEEIDNSQISAYSVGSSGKSESGVKASLSVTYEKNSKGQINITKVNGAWTPNSSLYSVSQREVIPRADGPGGVGKRTVYNPTSNSFNYSIKWGWITYYPSTSYSRSGANSSAKVIVTGMGGSHTISLSVAV